MQRLQNPSQSATQALQASTPMAPAHPPDCSGKGIRAPLQPSAQHSTPLQGNLPPDPDTAVMGAGEEAAAVHGHAGHGVVVGLEAAQNAPKLHRVSVHLGPIQRIDTVPGLAPQCASTSRVQGRGSSCSSPCCQIQQR